VHADGAFGLWALAAPATAHLARGFEQVDSAAADGHKWLNVPYDSGLVLAREPASLRSALAVDAAYLPDDDAREPFHLVPEMSRRARGVEVWAALRSLGRSGVAELVEGCCRHARRLAEGLSAGGAEVLNEVVLNQVLVAFGDAGRTRAVIDAVQREGTCWAGGTRWQGRAAMRLSVSSWATTEDDVEASLRAILAAAAGA
jgi:glutamate/tyrosine decarboxylase-like PLP-dependent enzyme